MKQNSVALIVGFIFAIGLGISGMTQPTKVLGFLNAYDWDPTLLLVMAGAVLIHLPLYRLVRKRQTPLLSTQWHIPTKKEVTPQLLLGSAIFGIGWGLAGYCPGPALTSLASGDTRPIVFVAAMLVGMLLFESGKKAKLWK